MLWNSTQGNLTFETTHYEGFTVKTTCQGGFHLWTPSQGRVSLLKPLPMGFTLETTSKWEFHVWNYHSEGFHLWNQVQEVCIFKTTPEGGFTFKIPQGMVLKAEPFEHAFREKLSMTLYWPKGGLMFNGMFKQTLHFCDSNQAPTYFWYNEL